MVSGYRRFVFYPGNNDAVGGKIQPAAEVNAPPAKAGGFD
jgi:hypothetical protein